MPVVGLDQEVKVIGLDGVLRDPEIGALRGGGEGRFQGAHDAEVA
jgi:hypothetical protein